MSSLFETMVYEREHHTPWAQINLREFIRAMAWQGAHRPLDNQVVLHVRYRNDVSSRIWHELEWTGADGERHNTAAQSFEKLLWRAAEIECQVIEKAKREKESKEKQP